MCNVCYLERVFVYFVVFQFFLIIICYNKVVQYKKEVDVYKFFFEKMGIENIVYNIVMCFKNYYCKYEF